MSKTDSSIAMRALKGNLNIEADVYNGKGKKKKEKKSRLWTESFSSLKDEQIEVD